MNMQINKWVGMTVFLGALVVETAGTRAIGIAQNPPDRSAPLASPRLFKQINPTILHQAPLTEAPRMFVNPINPRTLQAVPLFKYGILHPEIVDSSGQGPDFDRPIPLVSDIAISRSISLELKDILSIFEDVYQDKNPQSGIFYFLPRSYHLDWNPAEGYAMRMLYNASSKEGQAGEVLMTAQLSSGVDASEIQLARDLLTAAGHQVKALRAVPLAGPPEVSLSGGLKSLFNIPADRISSNPTSEALGEIDIAWSTDTVTKENIQLALTEEVGISGTVRFAPVGSPTRKPEIRIRIAIADRETFGKFLWARGQNWKNTSAYPIRLKYLHALMIRNQKPVIYSWNLGNMDIVPEAQVQWDARWIPPLVEQEAKRVWLDYSVLGGCEPCDKKVIEAITSGVSSVSASPLVFETITPLADTGAYKLFVTVRSQYLNPRAREQRVLPALSMTKDEQEYRGDSVYLGSRSIGEFTGSDPIFEYQITLVMRDGTTHQGATWIPSYNLRVAIGSAQINTALGFLPTRDGQTR
jgi:hypothetical protein